MVYSIPCQDCRFIYIGETVCHLSTRHDQHRDAVKKGNTEKSAVAEHAWKHQHRVAWDSAKILDHDSQSAPRKIGEALHIHRGSSLMNRDVGIDASHVWDPLFLS